MANYYNNGSNGNGNRGYSFLNIVTGLTNKNTQFQSATVIGTLSRMSARQINNGNSQIFEGSMAVNGRSKTVNKRFGTNFGDDEAVWLRVKFWEPENVLKALGRLGNPDRVRMALAGSMSKEEYTTKDGRKGVSLNLNVVEWKILDTASNGAGNNAAPQQAPQYNNNGAPQYNNSGYNDGFDSDGFVSLDGDDEDLPF